MLYANQWDNPTTATATSAPPGPRSGSRPAARVDGFICAIGTGGTLAGVGEFLKERQPDVRIVAADPMGAAMYHWIKHGELKSEGSSITEGIGQGRVTGERRRRADRRRLSDPRRGDAADRLRSAPARGAVPGRIERHQRRRRDPARARARPRAHRGDGPRRLRHALPEQAVQPGVPAREGPAGSGLAVARAISKAR